MDTRHFLFSCFQSFPPSVTHNTVSCAAVQHCQIHGPYVVAPNRVCFSQTEHPPTAKPHRHNGGFGHATHAQQRPLVLRTATNGRCAVHD